MHTKKYFKWVARLSLLLAFFRNIVYESGWAPKHSGAKMHWINWIQSKFESGEIHFLNAPQKMAKTNTIAKSEHCTKANKKNAKTTNDLAQGNFKGPTPRFSPFVEGYSAALVGGVVGPTSQDLWCTPSAPPAWPCSPLPWRWTLTRGLRHGFSARSPLALALIGRGPPGGPTSPRCMLTSTPI